MCDKWLTGAADTIYYVKVSSLQICFLESTHDPNMHGLDQGITGAMLRGNPNTRSAFFHYLRSFLEAT